MDYGEAVPNDPDTDDDGLCDGGVAVSGTCTGGWEDADRDGILDKMADGTLYETDPLALDSEVDGINDAVEDANHNGLVDSTETNPKVADTDNDGLRDGQETAGWKVGVWYERTMEKKVDYQVTSDGWAGKADSDGDGLTDFSEFLNGSDPRKSDTVRPEPCGSRGRRDGRGPVASPGRGAARAAYRECKTD